MTVPPPSSPRLIVVGGPNGAGKTSCAEILLPEGFGHVGYVNADTLAEGLSGFDPARVAALAGKIFLARIDGLLSEGRSFAMETTLSGRSHAARLARARRLGYSIEIVYVWLSSAELSQARVRERFLLGGHDIPEPALRRRYPRSVANFLRLYRPLAHVWRVYNNSGQSPRLVASGRGTDTLEIKDAGTWRRVLEYESGDADA